MSDGNEMQSLETPGKATPTTPVETIEAPTPGTEQEEGSLLDPPKEEQKAEPAAVEPLAATDLTFPEDVEVQEELRDEFLSIVNDAEMSSKDRAQALVNL